MKIILTIDIKKVGITEIKPEHNKDKMIMFSMKNFCEKFIESTYKYLHKYRINSFISYEIVE